MPVIDVPLISIILAANIVSTSVVRAYAPLVNCINSIATKG